MTSLCTWCSQLYDTPPPGSSIRRKFPALRTIKGHMGSDIGGRQLLVPLSRSAPLLNIQLLVTRKHRFAVQGFACKFTQFATLSLDRVSDRHVCH